MSFVLYPLSSATSPAKSRGVIPALAAGDIFGVIVFLVIAIVGILSKLQEGKKKKGDWEKPEDSPSVEPEDLPEPIRRMLYGDREQPIRTAKPAHPEQVRQPAQSVEPPIAPVRPAPPVRRTQQVPQQTRLQPRQQPVTIARPPARSPQSQPIPVRQVVVRKPAPPVTRPSYDDETRPRMQPVLQKPVPPKVVRATIPPVTKPVLTKAAPAPSPETLIKAALASDAAVKPIANPWRFKDKTDLRRAIVLSEILSPPLALRE